MATTASAQGKGVGKLMITHCIEEAKKRNAKKLILFSNTKLEPAIHLYRKFGFKEVPLENSTYARSNIKMELSLGMAE
jgi:ribosomal protein S18 acetylase RimI-like enzyme